MFLLPGESDLVESLRLGQGRIQIPNIPNSDTNTELGQFKYFIDAELSWFEVEFIHFLGGKNKSFGNKSCKIYYMILSVFHFPTI